jgi:Reticulon
VVLGVTIAAEVAGKLILNNGFATQLRPRKYYTVPKETLDAMIGDVHELINFFVIEAQRIVFAENIYASVVVCSPPPPLLATWSIDRWFVRY